MFGATDAAIRGRGARAPVGDGGARANIRAGVWCGGEAEGIAAVGWGRCCWLRRSVAERVMMTPFLAFLWRTSVGVGICDLEYTSSEMQRSVSYLQTRS